MITGVHTLIYSDDADATRAYLAQVFGWPSVDSGGGWLIFGTGPSELGVHPTGGEHGGDRFTTPRHHEISLMCDDIEATVRDLRDRGARFTRDVRDDGFGLTIELEVPGADPVLLYEPRHPVVADSERG